ncbi:hypothetical protein [Streptomyces sp. NPDC056194]|uniref:hypothetical protein n=1 Tax=Streptomyces sp. NPDC056194 TaxID=3345744 RepID=UPI0035E2D6A7
MSLPISFDRKFRPWRYSVSHSELKLRSVDPDSVREFIEVTFYGVVGMKLKTVYQSLAISLADPAQVEEMLKFSGVRESHSSRVRCLALKAASGDGLVACLSYSIWLHPKESDSDMPEVQHRDSVLILRG